MRTPSSKEVSSLPQRIPEQPWRAQSLAQGAAGVALLHIERALSGAAPWSRAHASITAATANDVSAADQACLFLGAPAVSFVLHAAAADGTGRYAAARATLDANVSALTHRRVDRSLDRIARRQVPVFAEYDLLHGLTGIGAHLLQHCPTSDALGRVLAYLVRLTEPHQTDDRTLPGWWVSHDPHGRHAPAFRAGHANFGIAHGIAGPLALLAQALRRGIVVDGHTDAIETICGFLDVWRQDADTGPWWPQWITRAELRANQTTQTGPARPSWCYGTPGLARAQQLAAIATGNVTRQRTAEDALARCLADPVQVARLTSPGLCHGWAGVFQTTYRAATDAINANLRARLPVLADQLVHHAQPATDDGTGLLEGTAGIDLALLTAARFAAPVSGWDACLLID